METNKFQRFYKFAPTCNIVCQLIDTAIICVYRNS